MSVPERMHRDLTANGVRLRVAEVGTGEPVVLLHGLLADHTTWDALAEHLEDDFQLVMPDLPGFGQSEKPPARRYRYGVNAFAEAIADLYGGLGLGRAALIGHGLGGAVALTVAAQHPELVSRLVLIDTLCYAPPAGVTHKLSNVPFVGSVMVKQLIGKQTFRILYASRLGVSAPRVDHYYEMFNSPAARGSALATSRSTEDCHSVVAHIARVQTPTLVLWGRNDRVYRAGFGQRLAREIRGAGFALLDAGHAPHEEQPAEVAEIVQRFLRAERPSDF